MKKYILRNQPKQAALDSFRTAYQSSLNEQQFQVATAPDSPALVIAGAGSGKTRTLIYRLAWLVHCGVKPESILLLTFTRRAAQEMLKRAAQNCWMNDAGGSRAAPSIRSPPPSSAGTAKRSASLLPLPFSTAPTPRT
ncbi:MAG: UvrD-helicase domain-containing protein [Candidatus Manganitrophus sp.]|nr:UvrD-helicase domain-containing protein [Candidatus Manganitrophus sp.]